MESLIPDKFDQDYGQFYGLIRYPKPVSTLTYFFYKNHLLRHGTHRKMPWSTRDLGRLLKHVYHQQDCFFGLSGLKGEFQGLGLWYIVSESRYLLLKRQNYKNIGWVSG